MSNKQLNQRERLALLLYVHGLETSPSAIFELACPEQYAANKFAASAATRWIQSKRVAAFVEAEKALLKERRDRHDEEVAARALASVVSGEGEAQTDKDYSNPDNRKRLLNRLIASSSDSKEILDALKLIATQPTGGSAEGARGSVHRFYTPLQCHQCPLYKEAKAKLDKKKGNI